MPAQLLWLVSPFTLNRHSPLSTFLTLFMGGLSWWEAVLLNEMDKCLSLAPPDCLLFDLNLRGSSRGGQPGLSDTNRPISNIGMREYADDSFSSFSLSGRDTAHFWRLNNSFIRPLHTSGVIVRRLPSQDRPWDVTPDKLSLQTLQKVGRAWEQAYQLCIPEKCSTLNWAVWQTRGNGKRI